MNIQQLEYIVAVDYYRHFAKAAEKAFVTQPTLSMMIKKLEDELGLLIFDRNKHPILPTPEGEEIIRRAKVIIAETNSLREYARELKGEIAGHLRLGIIPTLAPYLLPLFLRPFMQRHPQLKLYIYEMVTDEIIAKIKTGELDMGLLATPLKEPQLAEYPLFYEEFYAYASSTEKLPRKRYLLPKEIDTSHLWLLEEGHCLRNQVYDLCELRKQKNTSEHLQYEAGSIETLINLVDRYNGITIIPRLAMLNLKQSQRKNVREFSDPKPVREISVVVAKNFPRKAVLEKMKAEIIKSIPFDSNAKNKSVLSI